MQRALDYEMKKLMARDPGIQSYHPTLCNLIFFVAWKVVDPAWREEVPPRFTYDGAGMLQGPFASAEDLAQGLLKLQIMLHACCRAPLHQQRT